jgi:hypothetical protein
MPAIRWLAILPFVGMFVGPIVHNSATPSIFGLPFELGWIVIWILITAAIMALIYRFDPVRLNETEI